MRRIFTLFVCLLLSACATQRSYQWGDYENDLYSSYKDADKTEALRLNLDAKIKQLEQSNVKVAPGLYAELGTLYLQKGEPETAKLFYGKERDAWPESSQLMEALMKNIERLKKTPAGESK